MWAVGCGREGLGSRAVGDGNERLGALIGDNSVVDRGIETVNGWGRGCGMMVEGLSSQPCWDSSTKGLKP